MSSSPGGDGVAEARPAARSPFTVELVGEDGRTLDTYSHRGRSYVVGMSGGRYSIRIVNPTARRVEAVISVDGLDVIDGESADFRGKRGYVVPAHGELVVDGFRTSTTQVAAFRFSSVADSYAERKGKGRNIGVIGVAIFNEKAEPQIILPQEPVKDGRFDDDFGGDAEESAGTGGFRGAPSKAKRAPAPTSSGRVGGGGKGAADAPAAEAAPPPRTRTATRDEGESRHTETCCGPQRRQRPGLGTQFGEQRWSAVDFTRFIRANAKVPVAMAELRYNDAEGLRALGIRLQPSPDEDELMRRETADPFPSGGFASPPPQ